MDLRVKISGPGLVTVSGGALISWTSTGYRCVKGVELKGWSVEKGGDLNLTVTVFPGMFSCRAPLPPSPKQDSV